MSEEATIDRVRQAIARVADLPLDEVDVEDCVDFFTNDGVDEAAIAQALRDEFEGFEVLAEELMEPGLTLLDLETMVDEQLEPRFGEDDAAELLRQL